MPANSRRDRNELAEQLDPKHRDAVDDMVNEKVHDMVNEKVHDKINRSIDKALERSADKVARKTARHIESLDRLAAHLEVLDVWTRSEPGTRRPRFTREEIATTAIRIADADGFDAVSMRRIAIELGAGTMTLYHYVRTKDELLALIIDTLMAELVVPEGELPAGWREAMTVMANRSRAMLERHPWVLDIADDPNLGPNSVRHFDQSLQAVAGLDVSLEDMLDVVTVVDEYVFGYCLQQRTNFHDEPSRDVSDEMVAYVAELADSGGYPQLSRMMATYGTDEAWARTNAHAADPGRFGRNLTRILDGFEADFERSRQRQ